MKILANQLIAHDFNQLVQSVGWQPMPEAQITQALAGSTYNVAAYDDQQVIGMARVIGDGAFIFYIEDMIVHPDYQHQHVGTQLIQNIIDWLRASKSPDSMVTLNVQAATDAEGYYRSLGFEQSGLAMMQDIK